MSLDWIDVAAPAARGRLTTHGAHLTDWTPAGGPPVLFLSSAARFAPGQPIRGGIPLVFPWFGDDREGRGRPAHGFARRLPWRCVERRPDGDGELVVCELQDDDATRAMWPHAFRLRFEASFGATLRLRLCTTNRGRAPFRCETALHTYFAVGDATTASVEGLDGATYLDKPSGFAPRQQHGPVRFGGEVDRVYPGTTATCCIVDPTLRRRLQVHQTGMRSTVVWNPGPTRAARFADLGAGEWQRFVCVESGNVGDDAVEVAAGSTHEAEVRVTVAPA